MSSKKELVRTWTGVDEEKSTVLHIIVYLPRPSYLPDDPDLAAGHVTLHAVKPTLNNTGLVEP